jgi:hypothetical protein
MNQIRSLRENDTADVSLNALPIVMSAGSSENKAAIRIQSLFLRALALRTMTERFTFVWQRGIVLCFLTSRLHEASCIEDVKELLLAQQTNLMTGCFLLNFAVFDPKFKIYFWFNNNSEVTQW